MPRRPAFLLQSALCADLAQVAWLPWLPCAGGGCPLDGRKDRTMRRRQCHRGSRANLQTPRLPATLYFPQPGFWRIILWLDTTLGGSRPKTDPGRKCAAPKPGSGPDSRGVGRRVKLQADLQAETASKERLARKFENEANPTAPPPAPLHSRREAPATQGGGEVRKRVGNKRRPRH